MLAHAWMTLVMAAPVGSVEAADPAAPVERAASEESVALPIPPATTPPPPPSEEELAPAQAAYPSPPSTPSRTVSQWPDTRLFSQILGIGLGARWGQRTADGGLETGAILLGSVVARFAGYASDRPRFGGGRRFITPELSASVAVGMSIPSQVRILGAEGILRVGIGRSLASRLSPYVRLQFDPRFAGYLHDIAEGNFITVALRGSAGFLGRTRDESFVFLAGGVFDGVGGAQRIGPRSAIAQAMTGAELAIYAQPGERAFMLIGDVRTTLLGQQRGGQRIEGRATLELLFGQSMSVLATYSGTQIRVDTPLPRGAVNRELRAGHALMLSFGLSL